MANAGSVTVEVGVNLSRFESAMRQVDSRLSRLESKTAMVGRGFGVLGRNVDSAGRSLGRVTRGAFSATLSFIGLRGAVLAASGGFLGGAGLVYAMQRAVSIAISLEEQTNKVSVVFGSSSRAILNWSKTTATGIGLAQTAALEAAGTFGNMLRPLGILPKQAATMSKALVNLAGDMASFNNASLEDTLIAIRAGLAGEVEPLRRFGVFLSETRLKAEAIRAGLVNKGFKGVLDPLVKSLASYNLILKDTALTQGDYKRTADSTANVLRTIKAQVTDLAGAFGAGLEPVVNRVGIALRDKLGASSTRQAIEKLGRLVGEKLEDALKRIGTWFQQNWGGIQDGFRTAGDFLVIAASAAERLASALKAVADATPGGLATLLVAGLGLKGVAAARGKKGGGLGLAAAGLLAVPAPVKVAAVVAGTAGAGGARNYSANSYPALAELLGNDALFRRYSGVLQAMADGATISQSSPQALRRMEQFARKLGLGKSGVGFDREERRAAVQRGERARSRANSSQFGKPQAITSGKPLQTSGGSSKSKSGGSKIEELLPANLRLGLARAEVTQGTRDDIAAWKAIERWLEQRIRQTRNVNKQIQLLEELATARDKLASLKDSSPTATATRMTRLFSGPFLSSDMFAQAASFGYKAKPRDLLRDLRGQNAQLTTLSRSLRRLQKRGAPAGLIEELRGMGLEGADEASALAGASRGVFRQYVKAFQRNQQLDQRIQNMQVKSQNVTVQASHVYVGNAKHHGSGSGEKNQRVGTRVGARRAGR